MKVSNQRAFHLFKRAFGTAAISSIALFGSIAGSVAQVITVDFDQPSIDKNGYPHSSQGGGLNPTAFIFGAVGDADSDDRQAQFFNRFQTSGIVPSGQGFANYHILSATFTVSIAPNAADLIIFDGSPDSYTTYNPDGTPFNDPDPGRPIELFGAAFRGGLLKEQVVENTSYSMTGKGTRRIYATDFQVGASLNGTNRDVSNNVGNTFNPVPFAIGQVALADLNPNNTMKEDANVVFTLDLLNPDVLRYLQLSLDAGSIDLIVSSLHKSSQENPSNPYFYTKENELVGALPGRLDMQVVVVPEPSTVTLLLCVFGLFVGCWRGRQAIQSGGINI